MKTLLLLTAISLIPHAYSQEGSPEATTEENVDPSMAIKNNFAIGPYNREGEYEPSANLPEEKYQKQAMEETPELMPEPKEDN